MRTQTKSELKRLTKKFSKLKNDDDIMKNNELSEEKVEEAEESEKAKKAKKETSYE
jgi:hypothetical protein